MNNWKKYSLVCLVAAVSLFAYGRNARRSLPSDFRDAPRDVRATDSLKEAGPASSAADGDVPDASAHKGYVAGNDASIPGPAKPVEWIALDGGRFTMGTDSGENFFADAKPVHEVVIKTFDMSLTAVTVEQYAECVNKGGCTEPAMGEYCNWGKAGRQFHPVNCLNWDQASQYAKFKDARLPSEAEWEYAATSGGRNQKYPWGSDEATCDKAVMFGNGNYGCGKNSTMQVCSKPAGNTAQGLCDMAGNVAQWVQDKYQDSYKNTPADGRAYEASGVARVVRGGSFYLSETRAMRADFRDRVDPGFRGPTLGFRIAR